MGINLEEARKLAKLSRLDFSEEELGEFTAEFERTLEYISVLDKVDVSGVDLHESTLDAETELREDCVRPSLLQSEIVKNAPDEKDGAFKVPVTVE